MPMVSAASLHHSSSFPSFSGLGLGTPGFIPGILFLEVLESVFLEALRSKFLLSRDPSVRVLDLAGCACGKLGLYPSGNRSPIGCVDPTDGSNGFLARLLSSDASLLGILAILAVGRKLSSVSEFKAPTGGLKPVREVPDFTLKGRITGRGWMSSIRDKQFNPTSPWCLSRRMGSSGSSLFSALGAKSGWLGF